MKSLSNGSWLWPPTSTVQRMGTREIMSCWRLQHNAFIVLFFSLLFFCPEAEQCYIDNEAQLLPGPGFRSRFCMKTVTDLFIDRREKSGKKALIGIWRDSPTRYVRKWLTIIWVQIGFWFSGTENLYHTPYSTQTQISLFVEKKI